MCDVPRSIRLCISIAEIGWISRSLDSITVECKALRLSVEVNADGVLAESDDLPIELSLEDTEYDEVYPISVVHKGTSLARLTWYTSEQTVALQDSHGLMMGSATFTLTYAVSLRQADPPPRLLYFTPADAAAITDSLTQMSSNLNSIRISIQREADIGQALLKEKSMLSHRLDRVLLLSDAEIPLDAFEVETLLATRFGSSKLLKLYGRANSLFYRFKAINDDTVEDSSVTIKYEETLAKVKRFKAELAKPKQLPSPLATKLKAEADWLIKLAVDLQSEVDRLRADEASAGLGVADQFELETLPAENQLLRLRLQCTQLRACQSFEQDRLAKREKLLTDKINSLCAVVLFTV